MTIEKEALQFLKSEIFAGTRMATDKESALVPSGYEIQSLDEFSNVRSHYRAKFATDSLVDFVAYCKAASQDYGQEATVFYDGTKMQAMTIFDIGSSEQPGHCYHRANMAMKMTTPFAALCDVAGVRFTQVELYNWLQDWRHCVTIFEDDERTEVLPFNVALQRVRSINIESKEAAEYARADFGESRSRSASIEARAQGNQKLPAYIIFRCAPYPGLQERDFVLQVGLAIQNDKPMLKLRRMASDAAQEEIQNEFAALLQKEFQNVIRGTLSA